MGTPLRELNGVALRILHPKGCASARPCSDGRRNGNRMRGKKPAHGLCIRGGKADADQSIFKPWAWRREKLDVLRMVCVEAYARGWPACRKLLPTNQHAVKLLRLLQIICVESDMGDACDGRPCRGCLLRPSQRRKENHTRQHDCAIHSIAFRRAAALHASLPGKRRGVRWLVSRSRPGLPFAPAQSTTRVRGQTGRSGLLRNASSSQTESAAHDRSSSH